MDVDEQANDELLDFDEDQEFYDDEGADAGGDEQLDYGEEVVYDEAGDTAAQEGYHEEPAHVGDEADAEYLGSLQGETFSSWMWCATSGQQLLLMQPYLLPAAEDAEDQAAHMQSNGNEQAVVPPVDLQQGDQEQSAGGKKIIDLTRTSNRVSSQGCTP